MKKKRKMAMIFSVVVCLVVVLPIVSYFFFFIYLAFFFDPCEIENFEAAVSPNGKMSVYIYSVDCGATTGFNTRASLAPTKKNYIPDGSKQFLYLRGQHGFRVKWIDAATVEMIASDAAEAFGEGRVVQRENAMDGVAISYR